MPMSEGYKEIYTNVMPPLYFMHLTSIDYDIISSNIWEKSVGHRNHYFGCHLHT